MESLIRLSEYAYKTSSGEKSESWFVVIEAEAEEEVGYMGIE